VLASPDFDLGATESIRGQQLPIDMQLQLLRQPPPSMDLMAMYRTEPMSAKHKYECLRHEQLEGSEPT
jgi:hypothetical protein